MDCDVWLVPLVDALCHNPENPFRDELAAYDAALVGHGLPTVPVRTWQPGTAEVRLAGAFDHESLHYLRRAYLLHRTGFPVTPVERLGEDYDRLLETFEAAAQFSHLVWHYDHAGAYLPIDFPQPLMDDPLPEEGGPLGSSLGMLRELEDLAPFIGVDLLDPPRPTPTYDGAPFARERFVWATLYAAAQESVTLGAMVVFA
ncbi:hypothetical protein ACFRCG_09760 [Embleya sp. NPDC056575]|uniref:hypothetical protein n=1 Tax=unclassified Embleya TaxID=2699296 RepID=UPI0036CA69C2